MSVWRVLVLLRRLANQATPSPERLPSPERAASVVRRLLQRGDLQRVRELRSVYAVVSPYAFAIPLSDEQLVQEANPLCFFSHLTALVHHNLTEVIPNRLYASTPAAHTERLPLGTTAEDWIDLALPLGQQPPEIHEVPIVWSKPRTDGGVGVAHRHGSGIYITDLERTLLDVLREPAKAHGITTVLRAWRQASDQWDLARLLRYADDGPVVRQRVGYLVERLGQTGPVLAEWKTRLQRGGSMKLLGTEPYAPTYSDVWNLSLNVPDSVLGVLDD